MGCIHKSEIIKSEVSHQLNPEELFKQSIKEENIQKVNSLKIPININKNVKSNNLFYVNSNNSGSNVTSNNKLFSVQNKDNTINSLLSNDYFNSKYTIIGEINNQQTIEEFKIQLKSNPSEYRCMRKIKKISSEKLHSESEDNFVFEQINLLKGIDHKHICKIYDCINTTNNYFLIMDYCKEGNLDSKLKWSIKYSESQIKYLAFQLFGAIKYLNEKKLIHTDIKPTNILIDEIIKNDNGEDLFKIKLLNLDSYGENLDNNNTNIFPYYIAPEVIDNNEKVTSDIWSVGVIIYQMFYGEVPFGGDNLNEVYSNIKNGKIIQNSNSSLALKDLLNLIFVKDYSKRITVDKCLEHNWFHVGIKTPRDTEIFKKNLVEEINTDTNFLNYENDNSNNSDNYESSLDNKYKGQKKEEEKESEKEIKKEKEIELEDKNEDKKDNEKEKEKINEKENKKIEDKISNKLNQNIEKINEKEKIEEIESEKENGNEVKENINENETVKNPIELTEKKYKNKGEIEDKNSNKKLNIKNINQNSDNIIKLKKLKINFNNKKPHTLILGMTKNDKKKQIFELIKYSILFIKYYIRIYFQKEKEINKLNNIYLKYKIQKNMNLFISYINNVRKISFNSFYYNKSESLNRNFSKIIKEKINNKEELFEVLIQDKKNIIEMNLKKSYGKLKKSTVEEIKNIIQESNKFNLYEMNKYKAYFNEIEFEMDKNKYKEIYLYMDYHKLLINSINKLYSQILYNNISTNNDSNNTNNTNINNNVIGNVNKSKDSIKNEISKENIDKIEVVNNIDKINENNVISNNIESEIIIQNNDKDKKYESNLTISNNKERSQNESINGISNTNENNNIFIINNENETEQNNEDNIMNEIKKNVYIKENKKVNSNINKINSSKFIYNNKIEKSLNEEMQINKNKISNNKVNINENYNINYIDENEDNYESEERKNDINRFDPEKFLAIIGFT